MFFISRVDYILTNKLTFVIEKFLKKDNPQINYVGENAIYTKYSKRKLFSY